MADLEPCDHPGCLSHVSHPCEGCGRQWGPEPMPDPKPVTEKMTDTLSAWALSVRENAQALHRTRTVRVRRLTLIETADAIEAVLGENAKLKADVERLRELGSELMDAATDVWNWHNFPSDRMPMQMDQSLSDMRVASLKMGGALAAMEETKT